MTGQQRPEPLAAPLANPHAQTLTPKAGRTELAAPRPQPTGEQMQRIFLGKADGSMHRMGDADTDAGGFGCADFCRGDGQRGESATGLRKGGLGGNAGGGGLFGKYRQLLLNGLERTDGLAELLALTGVVGGHVQ